jgi:sulfide:quinone oxidoreductase
MMANHLRKKLRSEDWRITVVDRSAHHYYQPGFLLLPFGDYHEDQIVRPTKDFLPRDANFVQAEVSSVDAAQRQVELADGRSLQYDILIIATGCRIAPEETEGMLGPQWRKNIFDFYTFEGSKALRDKLATWPGGKLVVHINEMPIKCPPAPLEFTFLAESFFRKRGMRDKVDLTFVTPLSGAFTKPKASQKLAHMMGDRGITVVTDFVVERVDQEANKLICYDGREVPYDLLVTTPTNLGSAAMSANGIGDEMGYVPTHKHTLQTLAHPEIFALGDATNLPASKAGSVAHFEAETLVDNILRHIEGKPMKEEFDGHSNCFVESGDGKAMLIDFNYQYEPHEGGFPFSFGPLRLLKESRLNHWAKLAFRHIYWHMLLMARPLPFISRNKKPPSTV